MIGGKMGIEFDLEKIKITPLLDTLVLEDISDEEYFSKKFSNRLSNSRLGILKSKGVKAFFENYKFGYNPSFQFGENLHTLVLQPESFELVEEVIKPTAKAGLMADYLYKEDGTTATDDEIRVASIKCDYYKDSLTAKKIELFRARAEGYWRDRYIFEQKHPKKDDKIRIYTDCRNLLLLKECIASLEKNKEIQELLHPTGILKSPYSACERSILIDFKVECEGAEPVIYKWKSKLDNFTIDDDVITVNDLKTTANNVNEFDKIVKHYSYNREIAIYSWLLKMCSKKFFGIDNPKVKGNFLVVSTIPNYDTTVYKMTSKDFITGFNEFKYLLRCVYYLNIIKGHQFS